MAVLLSIPRSEIEQLLSANGDVLAVAKALLHISKESDDPARRHDLEVAAKRLLTSSAQVSRALQTAVFLPGGG